MTNGQQTPPLQPQQATASPPVAPRRPIERTFHGRTFTDDYEWLRDKDSAEVRSHLEAENAYTQSRTAHLQPLADAIFGEVKARVKETDLSLPVRSGNWWYFSRSTEGKSYAAMCRIPVGQSDGHGSARPAFSPMPASIFAFISSVVVSPK
ncbi:hypothetical protein DLJ54_07305 [Corynebacterium heidelbergense]|uniref:Peptidase S9A N-terminal domain-containing protein n=1 Tax=Corynebacterium heidelbergense TaxID=2055947 RepID=A0A364V4W2_9CORY|nr:hypothetical protein DLJ54_07305 [Corynebacterium heidelbergense]